MRTSLSISIALILAAGSAHITGQTAPNWLTNPKAKTRYFSY